MKFHVARQPIFNRKLQVYGYELLYRQTDTENFYNPPPHIDGDQASSNVIINSFYNIGIDEMTAGRKAFINFTGNFIAQEVATLFPSETLVVEILESVLPTDEIIERCEELKRLGYDLALDDYVLTPENEDLLKIADIVKVDFTQANSADIERTMRAALRPGLRFLAEKIETREMSEAAQQLGFHFYQGYFFSKPVIVSGEEFRPLPVNCLRLIQLVNRPDFNFTRVSAIIMRDVSLSYQLLKLVNSVAFGFTVKIKTIHHALVALGTREVRKWVSLVSMMGISAGQPRELNRVSLIRAKFCETIAIVLGKYDGADAFMAGLFSLMDVIMARPFEVIFRDIAVSDETRAALVDGKGPYRVFIDLILTYERGEWDEMEELAARAGLSPDTVGDAYRDAVHSCNEIFGSVE